MVDGGWAEEQDGVRELTKKSLAGLGLAIGRRNGFVGGDFGYERADGLQDFDEVAIGTIAAGKENAFVF